jgi:hypothetical protein
MGTIMRTPAADARRHTTTSTMRHGRAQNGPGMPLTASPSQRDKPMMYGYLYLPEQAPVDMTIGWCQSLRDYADQYEFNLVTVFHDTPDGTYPGYQALVTAIGMSGAHDVVIRDIQQPYARSAGFEARIGILLSQYDAEIHYAN